MKHCLLSLVLLGFVGSVYGKDLLVEDFESPDVITYSESSTSGQAPPGWVRATQGYRASYNGLIDKNTYSNFTAAASNEQAYAFRYTNAGVTTDKDVIGPLYTGLTYTVSIDAVIDGYNSATAFRPKLIAWPYGAARDDCRSQPAGALIVKQLSMTVTNTTFTNISFSITFDSNHVDHIGYDLALRFSAGSMSIIDNVVVTSDEVGDQIPPLVQWQYPADNYTKVSDIAKLVLIYHEDIFAGTGNITIKKTSDDSTVEVIPVGSVGIAARTATITPSSPLVRETEYYVLMDAGVFQDGVGNGSLAVSSSTAWSFTTGPDDATSVLLQDSFESPVVSGSKKTTAPDNWVRGTANTSSGLANTNTGTFSTPFGAQAATVWNSSASLTLDEGILEPKVEALVAEQEYRITFSAADATDLGGAYNVSLMAFTNGAVRTDTADGVVLTNVSGTASMQDMGQELVGVSFTASASNPNLGDLVGVRIQGSGALVDNLTLSWVPPPAAGTVLIIK